MSRSRTVKPATDPTPATPEQEPTTAVAATPEQEQEPTGEPTPATDPGEQEQEPTPEQEPTGDAVAAEETDPGDTFRAAVDAAIESSASGAVPAASMDAVFVAVRGLKGNVRRDLPTAYLSGIIAANMPPAPNGDIMTAAAANTILAGIAAMPAASTAKVPAKVADPIGDAAAILATFHVSREMILAEFGDADRAAVDAKVAEMLASADGFVAAWPRGIGSRKVAAKVATGEPTDRKKGGSVAGHVVAVLTAADPGAVLRVSEIAAVKLEGYAPSAGAINAALDRGIAGVELTTVPGAAGKATRAVRLAADAA